MAATAYVIRNTQERPDRHGVVRPYLTRNFDGRSYPVAFTEEQLGRVGTLGTPEPAPADLETVWVDARDTHDYLSTLEKGQRETNRLLFRIAENLDRYEAERNRPTPPNLTRWQRFKLRLRRKSSR